jgi:biotin-(acetyl-CoA carboxylase) ligase
MAGSLRDACGDRDIVFVEEMLGGVLDGLDRWFCAFEKFGFLRVKDYWLRHISGIGCNTTIKNGSDSLSGTVRGIDDFGRLILEKDNRNLFISSGDMLLDTERIAVKDE